MVGIFLFCMSDGLCVENSNNNKGKDKLKKCNLYTSSNTRYLGRAVPRNADLG